jgi:hypothetical protein
MRKSEMTPEQFIATVVARLKKGMDYPSASGPYVMAGVESEPARGADGVREVTESTLDMDGGLELYEAQAMDSGAYDALGWQGPADDPHDTLLDVLDDVMRRSRHALLHAYVSTLLSKQEQAVVHAMFWDDVPQAEIARGLGISRQAVNSAYCRALGKLREAYGLPAEPDARVWTVRQTQTQKQEAIFAAQKARGAALDQRFARMSAVFA